MKRIVVGTFAQCMCVINRSEKLGDEGYDYYEMSPTTDEERTLATDATAGKRIAYNSTRGFTNKHLKYQLSHNLFTLTLYRDNEARKTVSNYNRAMKPLQT